jgi:hypothetical protein
LLVGVENGVATFSIFRSRGMALLIGLASLVTVQRTIALIRATSQLINTVFVRGIGRRMGLSATSAATLGMSRYLNQVMTVAASAAAAFRRGIAKSLTAPVTFSTQIGRSVAVRLVAASATIAALLALRPQLGPSASRILRIAAEVRALLIAPENRSVAVVRESRAIDVEAEARKLQVEIENRTRTVPTETPRNGA